MKICLILLGRGFGCSTKTSIYLFIFQLNFDSINYKVVFGLVWFVVCDGAVSPWFFYPHLESFVLLELVFFLQKQPTKSKVRDKGL